MFPCVRATRHQTHDGGHDLFPSLAPEGDIMVTKTAPESQKMDGQNQAASDASEKPIAELKDVCDAAYQGFCEYAKSKPETIALWCLGIGFVLGWKLKPW